MMCYHVGGRLKEADPNWNPRSLNVTFREADLDYRVDSKYWAIALLLKMAQHYRRVPFRQTTRLWSFCHILPSRLPHPDFSQEMTTVSYKRQ